MHTPRLAPKWRRVALGAMLMASSFSWPATTVATAEGPQLKAVGDSSIVYVSDDGGNALLISGARRIPKTRFDPVRDATSAGVVIKGTPLWDWYMSGEGHIPGPGGGANVQAYFNSHINGDCGFFTCEHYLDGNSHARWWGNDPWNADAMDLSDRYHENGCSVSVTFPPGVGFSGGGDTVNWDSGWYGPTWAMDHYYDNIHFTAWCGVFGWDQTTSTTARFGSSYYSTAANGSAF